MYYKNGQKLEALASKTVPASLMLQSHHEGQNPGSAVQNAYAKADTLNPLISNYLNKNGGMNLFKKGTINVKKDGSNGFKKSFLPQSGEELQAKKSGTMSFSEGQILERRNTQKESSSSFLRPGNRPQNLNSSTASVKSNGSKSGSSKKGKKGKEGDCTIF